MCVLKLQQVRRKSSNSMAQSDARTPRGTTRNSYSNSHNEPPISEETFILKGKYTFTNTPADSSSPRVGKFNPFAPRTNRITDLSDKDHAETEQLKYELLKMVGSHPNSRHGHATADLVAGGGNVVPSMEPYPLQRSGAFSLLKAGTNDGRQQQSPAAMAPEELYRMNDDGFLDVLRISDTKARISEHNRIYQHQQQHQQQQQQPHSHSRSRSNPSRVAARKA